MYYILPMYLKVSVSVKWTYLRYCIHHSCMRAVVLGALNVNSANHNDPPTLAYFSFSYFSFSPPILAYIW